MLALYNSSVTEGEYIIHCIQTKFIVTFTDANNVFKYIRENLDIKPHPSLLPFLTDPAIDDKPQIFSQDHVKAAFNAAEEIMLQGTTIPFHFDENKLDY